MKKLIVSLFIMGTSTSLFLFSFFSPKAFAEEQSFSISTNLYHALSDLLNGGPNRWVSLPTTPKGKYQFIRGLSGCTSEALRLLSGIPNHDLRTVTFIANPEFKNYTASSINAYYSLPLTVIGRTDEFTDPDLKLTEMHIHNLQNLSFLSEQGGPGDRSGEYQQLEPGRLTLSEIEAIGFILSSKTMRGPHSWARQFMNFYEALVNLGITINHDSVGYHFYLKIKEARARDEIERGVTDLNGVTDVVDPSHCIALLSVIHEYGVLEVNQAGIPIPFSPDFILPNRKELN